MNEPIEPGVWRMPGHCPRCRYDFTASGVLVEDDDRPARPPEHGDLSCCMACGAPLEIVEGGVRWLTFHECQRLTPEERGQLARAVMIAVTLRHEPGFAVRFMREFPDA